MTVTTRARRSDGQGDTADLETRLAAAEHMVTILLRVLSRDVVMNRPGTHSASFRQIMTGEQRIATLEEVADIEAWLTDHR